jgi:hypothetical protein
MTPPPPVRDGLLTGAHRVLHLDRRRLVLLGSAGVFLVVAVVFGALAFTRSATAQPASGVVRVVPVTITTTMTVPPPSPSPGSTPVPSSSPAPATVVVTVTTTQTVAEKQPGGGVNVGAVESGASTLGTVVAAACAVIALRPQRRTPPPAAAAGAPAGSPGA